MAGKVRKRRVHDGCPNPLFVKWVEELRDEAVEKNMKSQYAYSKALSSLHRYPLPLSSGQEAKMLDHVGEKLAKILDKRLAHYKERGCVDEIENDSVHVSVAHIPNEGKKKRKKESSSTTNRDTACSEGSSCTSTPQPKRKKSAAPREYIPVYRSGPYALIVALYNAEQKPSWCGYLHKAELIAEAQPYADSSFTVAEAGSYYTAWSSVSLIVDKGLVIRYSHPPKFKLSEKGVSLAVKLIQGGALSPQSQESVASPTNETPANDKSEPGGSDGRRGNGVGEKRVASPLSTHKVSDHSVSSSPGSTHSEDHLPSILPNSEPSPNPSLKQQQRRLEFWYVNPEGQQVNSKDEAAVTFNQEISVGFLIKCRQKDLEDSIFKYTIDNLRSPDGEFVFAYLNNEQGPDYSNPPVTHGHTPNPCLSTSHSTHSISHTPLSTQALLDRTLKSSNWTQESSNSAPMIITLSDSDTEGDSLLNTSLNSSSVADDMEILRPLSERVGFKRKVPETPSDCASKASRVAKTSSSSQEEKALTPAQKAGMAAISRMEVHQCSRARDEQALRACTTSTSPISRTSHQSSKERTPLSPRTTFVVDLTESSDDSCTDHSQVNTRHSSPKETHNIPPAQRSTIGLTNPSSKEAPQIPTIQRSTIFHQGSAKGQGSRFGATIEGLLEGVELGSPEFVLRPGEFEVILCVDSSESAASRKHTSQFRGLLLQELAKNGVQFDVRRLTVGDFLWVGREKVQPVTGQLGLPPSREVVLEYIVERKRMDDLAGSITDGRFSEQKFRLKSCGLCHPVYLVEEYKDMTHFRLPPRSLNQSIANTQVIDGFYVKRTKDIRESIAYLTIMTRQLQRHYADKTLKAYSHEAITGLVRTKHKQSSENLVHSMPFKAFNEASIKNKVLSVYEMFGRHLIQLPGMSADKAVAVLQHYPAVACLHQAYQQCSSTGECTKLLSSIKAGKTKRRLGDGLSSLVYSLYCLGKDT